MGTGGKRAPQQTLIVVKEALPLTSHDLSDSMLLEVCVGKICFVKNAVHLRLKITMQGDPWGLKPGHAICSRK